MFFNSPKSTSIYLLRLTSKFIILNFLANENVCIKLHYFPKNYHYTDVTVITKHIQCGLCCAFSHIHTIFAFLSRSAKCFCSQQNFEVICVKNVSSYLFMVFGYLLKLLYFTTKQPDTNRNIIISHSFCFIYCNVAIHNYLCCVRFEYYCVVCFMFHREKKELPSSTITLAVIVTLITFSSQCTQPKAFNSPDYVLPRSQSFTILPDRFHCIFKFL